MSFVGKLFALMIAWLLFNTLEIATLGINVYNLIFRSPVGKLLTQAYMIAFDILDNTASSSVTTLVFTVSLILGNPTRTNKTPHLRKASIRPYSMRSVPWKRGVMKKISLLAFASNTIGSASMRKRRPQGTIHSLHAFVTNAKNSKSKSMCFDTDSFPIKVDNCCTCRISPHIGDFIGPVQVVKDRAVQSFNGQVTPVKHKGMIRWMIDDDQGVAREIIIPNSYHIPSAPHRMLSPQHWAQQADDNTPEPRGTWCATYHD
jgi:hypothetical protein